MLYFTTNMTQPQLAIHSTIMNTTEPQFARTPELCSSVDIRSTEPKWSIEKLKELYLETLTPKEHKSYIIARDHLGMSFTLEKSVGFLQWKTEFIKNT
jgi:hypothetical protein